MLKWENPMRSNNKPSIWGWYVYDWVTTLFNGWAYGNIRKPRFFWKTNFPPSVGLFPVDFHIIRFWEMHARSDIDDHWCSMRRSKETKEDPENIWEPIQKAEFPHVCNDCDVILVSCAPTSVKTHNSKPIRDLSCHTRSAAKVRPFFAGHWSCNTRGVLCSKWVPIIWNCSTRARSNNQKRSTCRAKAGLEGGQLNHS